MVVLKSDGTPVAQHRWRRKAILSLKPGADKVCSQAMVDELLRQYRETGTIAVARKKDKRKKESKAIAKAQAAAKAATMLAGLPATTGPRMSSAPSASSAQLAQMMPNSKTRAMPVPWNNPQFAYRGLPSAASSSSSSSSSFPSTSSSSGVSAAELSILSRMRVPGISAFSMMPPNGSGTYGFRQSGHNGGMPTMHSALNRQMVNQGVYPSIRPQSTGNGLNNGTNNGTNAAMAAWQQGMPTQVIQSQTMRRTRPVQPYDGSKGAIRSGDSLGRVNMNVQQNNTTAALQPTNTRVQVSPVAPVSPVASATTTGSSITSAPTCRRKNSSSSATVTTSTLHLPLLTEP